MDDDQIAEKLKAYLISRTDQDSKNMYIGAQRFSLRELYKEVDKRTEIGNKMIGLSRKLIEKTSEKDWEKMLKK